MAAAAAGAIKFVVIGSPGHGKSTALNEFAEDDLFKVSSSGQACTQAGGEWDQHNNRKIIINDGKMDHELELVDTPGFPDPDPEKAAAYYDHVVARCNEPINGVLFILKPEREMCDILERYAVLLKEFVNLNVPLVILANGTEPGRRKRESEADYSQRREEGLKNFRSIARTIEKRAQLHAREILVSYTLDDLHALGKDVLAAFAASPPQASGLRSFEEMRKLMKEAEDVEVAAKQKVEHEECRISKCRKDIASLEEEISNLHAWHAGTCWIPFSNFFTGPILLSKISDKTLRIKELYDEIGDAEGARRAAGDLEKMRQETSLAQKAFEALARYLVGQFS